MRGFTLIEILVSAAILMMLSGMIVLYSRQGESQISLKRMSDRVASDINSVKSMALAFKPISGVPTDQICGYGIYFPNPGSNGINYYILYVKRSLAGNCAVINNGRDSNDIDLSKYYLDNQIVISGLSSSANLDIIFQPPDPRVFMIQSNPPNPDEAIITLSIIGTAFLRRVKINSIGMVYVEP